MPITPPRADTLVLYRAAAETLTKMALQVEELGADLCADPVIINNHISSLQTIDRLAQHLDQIADVISSEDPIAAIDRVKLTELQDHLSSAVTAPARAAIEASSIAVDGKPIHP